MVSWSLPQFPPDSYNVSYSCQLLCVSELYLSSSDTVNGSVTTHTITSLNAGSNCTVSVTAVYGSVNCQLLAHELLANFMSA